MDMKTKTTATNPSGFPKTEVPQAFREMAEKGTTQAKETYEKMSAATTEAADLIKNSYSTAVQGAYVRLRRVQTWSVRKGAQTA